MGDQERSPWLVTKVQRDGRLSSSSREPRLAEEVQEFAESLPSGMFEAPKTEARMTWDVRPYVSFFGLR